LEAERPNGNDALHGSDWRAGLLRAGEVGFAVADFVGVQHFYFDAAIGVGRAAGIGIVAQAILRAQLTVDAIEDDVQVLRGVREKDGAAGSVGDGFDGMFPGGVAAALIF
jgi:hypothetical protein